MIKVFCLSRLNFQHYIIAIHHCQGKNAGMNAPPPIPVGKAANALEGVTDRFIPA
jgi:hypothetical protein